MDEKTRKMLEKQHYALIGAHSGIQICRWTKKSLRNEGVCYKEQFYGIKSHRCCQMTCCFLCMNQCLHCWRAIEMNKGSKLNKVDSPKEIIDKCFEKQRKMLTGFKGYEKVDIEKWKEAQNPTQFAISLSGEPTIYPKIAELIQELRKRKITSFIVTNGLVPLRLIEMEKKKALPTQLYVSLNYPTEELFRIITRNKDKNAWRNFNKTLNIMKELKTRTVVRINLIKELNMNNEEKYAELVKKASPDFIELKGYMSVGFARKRLGYERMPLHKEIKDFSNKILKFLPDYKFLDEKQESRVILLGKSKEKMRIKESEI